MSLSLSIYIYYIRTLCHYVCPPPKKYPPNKKKWTELPGHIGILPLLPIRISVNLLHLRCQRHSTWQVHEPTLRPSSRWRVRDPPPRWYGPQVVILLVLLIPLLLHVLVLLLLVLLILILRSARSTSTITTTSTSTTTIITITRTSTTTPHPHHRRVGGATQRCIIYLNYE